MKTVIVLDANQRSALAVVRSLGKHNIHVFTADETPAALAGCSRFSKRYFMHPSPRLHPERFVAMLAEIAREQHIDILLPMTELTTMLLLENRASFPDSSIPFPNMSTVDALANKCSLMRMAETLNIPFPRTWFADNPASLPCTLEELPFPVVLKPGKSWIHQHGQWERASVRIAHTPTEAREILETDPALAAHPFMLQEFVPGHGQGVFALYNNGAVHSFFAHRRLREKPPDGGVSVLSESVPVDPKMQSHARALLDRAGWHGIAMVEFRVAADGTPYLMEINTRFWGSLQLAIDAGVDFPYMLYQLSIGTPSAPVDSYQTGIRLRWLLGDVDNLYLTLRSRRYPLRLKLAAMMRFFIPSPFRTRHEIDRWGDWGPAWHEFKEYIMNILT